MTDQPIKRVFRLGLIAALALAGWFSAAPDARAQLSLSSRFLQGGIDLDFGRIEAGSPSIIRELEITMTSTGGDGQYRLYEEVSGFLTNQQGTRLPQGAIVFQISRGLSGTPSTGAITPLEEFPQELFVSNSQGSSDSLVIAYSMSSQIKPDAGNYRGVLRFTLESKQTGLRTTATVNVRLTITAVVQLERLPAAVSQLRFSDVELGKQSVPLDFSFRVNNNASGRVSLIQELIEPLAGSQGQYFPVDGLLYTVTSTQGSTAWQAASSRPEQILSDAQGDVRDIRISYAVMVPKDQRAGIYRGRVRLQLMGAGGVPSDQWTLPVEVEVREVFNVSVSIVEGGEELRFRRDSTSSGQTEHLMRVTVTTNAGKPYQVLGGLDHALVLPSGESLSASALTWVIEEAKQGKPLVPVYTPVTVGFEPIYQSDSSGNSESFLLRYKMSIPADARDGTYSGRLHFSVTVF